jgi:hypothetical protein
MRNKLRSIHRFCILVLIFALPFGKAIADDPGITKVRLLQQSDTIYIFEADVPQMLLNTIKKPIFPERFQISDFSFDNQSGWITLKLTISTSGASLNQDDEILLPWLRNGVDLTAQWQDGTTYKGLFSRTLNGIHIPMKEIMPTDKTTLEVLKEAFISGVRHLSFMGIHILLVFVLVWFLPSGQVIKYLLWYTFGQAITMVFAELNVPGLDLLSSELVLILFVFVFSLSIAYKRKFNYAGIALLLSGIAHGLSFVNEISSTPLQAIQRIQALFAFNLAIDLGHFILAGIGILIIPLLKKALPAHIKFETVTGGIAVFLLFLVFQNNVNTGKTDILFSEKSNTSAPVRVPAPGQATNRQVQRGSGIMTTPIMVFLSIEQYAVRQEILIKANEALRSIDPSEMGDTIPVDIQEQFKKEVSEAMLASSHIKINSLTSEPDDISVNFVSLSRGGVSVRETPRVEIANESILGITMIYDTEQFPDSVGLQWQYFPNSVQEIETSVVDPYGAFTLMLTEQNMNTRWQSRLKGIQQAALEPVVFEQYPIPLASILLWIATLIGGLVLVKSAMLMRKIHWLLLIAGVGFVVYPFLRTRTSIPLMVQFKPSNERTSIVLNDLLSNIYRAFDKRKEEDVYDRLALSVTGDQLTEVYIQNRQVMALENRGGARANVDEINVLKVNDVRRGRDDSFVADALWSVRGSVNHFGHTHYRQNQYHALVSLVNENNVWKIIAIETIEEKRIY